MDYGKPGGSSSGGDRVGLKLEQERRVSDNQEEDETRRECTGCWGSRRWKGSTEMKKRVRCGTNRDVGGAADEG